MNGLMKQRHSNKEYSFNLSQRFTKVDRSVVSWKHNKGLTIISPTMEKITFCIPFNQVVYHNRALAILNLN